MLKRTTNKKVKNATPIEVDGIRFRSTLESFVYKLLKENNIPFLYEKETITFIPAFEYLGKKIRPWTYTPDFTGDNFVIEVKGWANDAFPNKWKLLKYMYFQQKKEIELFLVHSKKEAIEAVEKIKELCQIKNKKNS